MCLRCCDCVCVCPQQVALGGRTDLGGGQSDAGSDPSPTPVLISGPEITGSRPPRRREPAQAGERLGSLTRAWGRRGAHLRIRGPQAGA